MVKTGKTTRPLADVVEAVTNRKRVTILRDVPNAAVPGSNSLTARMEALDAVLGEVAPQWRPKGPPGGFIASELKKIHDDSVSVFPESVYNGEGRRHQGRWATTMKSDYIPIAIMKEQAEMRKGVKATMGNAPADDVGVSGTMGVGKPSMFQTWNVPSRVTESRGRSSVDQLSEQLEEIRLESARGPSVLPVINGAAPRPATVASMVGVRPATKRSVRRQPKSLAAKMVMDKYHAREEGSTANRWLAQASDADRQMAVQALQVPQPKVKATDVVQPVKKWLTEASPKEREVALTFFQSLAGTQLMGGTMDKKERVDQVIQLLEHPPNKYDSGAGSAKGPLTPSKRPRHIKVLTSSARKNKWRHQTWHHLPSYPNKNKVLNKSSILIEPHSTVHRHFTIHPDWGP